MTSYRKSTESWSSVVAMSLLSLIKATRYGVPYGLLYITLYRYRYRIRINEFKYF
jgi:hypothetical protein